MGDREVIETKAETDVIIPPGEYAVPGLPRLLVIEGVAKSRAPSGPSDLSGFLARPPDPAEPKPTPTAGAGQSPLVLILLAIVGLLGGAWLPSAAPDKPTPPPEPPPAPRPVEPEKPKRPDWIPDLERIGDRLDGLESRLESKAGASPAEAGPPVGAGSAAPAQPAPVVEPIAEPAAYAPAASYAPAVQPTYYYLPSQPAYQYAPVPCATGYCPTR